MSNTQLQCYLYVWSIVDVLSDAITSCGLLILKLLSISDSINPCNTLSVIEVHDDASDSAILI